MPAIRKRPGMVTFVAIVLIILGALALLGGACGGGVQAIGLFQADDGKVPDPMDIFGTMGAMQRAIAREAPGYTAVTILRILASLFFGVAGVGLGIGLLKLNPLSRKLAVAVTIVHVLFSLASQAYGIGFEVPATTKFQQEQFKKMAKAPNAPDMAAAAQVGGQIGAAIGLGCGVAVELTIALLIVIGLNTQSAKIAFGVVPPPADDDYDDDRRGGRNDDGPRDGVRPGDPPTKYKGYEEHDD